MERLPSEIQYIIFSNVYNLKECQLVCKSWYALITDEMLHRFVTILWHNSVKFTFYEERQDLAKHVRNLDVVLHSNEKAFALPDVFPNLQHLDVSADSKGAGTGGVEYRNQIKSLAKIPYWTSSIRSITERNYYTPLFTSLWLETAAAAGETLVNLTVLHIEMFDYKEFNKRNIHMQAYNSRKRQFLHSLRLTNALQHLTLEEIHVSWQDLDTIHENAPRLRSLSLINTTLRLNENAAYPYSNINSQIEHASHLPKRHISSLKRLVIDLRSGKNWNGPQPHRLVKFWVQQIALKYTDLTSFTLQCRISMRSTNYKEEDTLSILPMMASCQRLTDYKIILYLITEDLLVAMDQNNIKLRTLAFETTHQDSLKKQLSLLSHSDQSNHLQCLEIRSNYPGGHYEYSQKRALREEFQPFDASLFQSLSTFSQLTTLEFNCTFARSCELAHLIQILSYCKTLLSLTIHHASVSDVFYMSQHSRTTPFSQLKYLTITELNINRGSQTLVEINLILGSVLKGLQDSLREIYLEFGSITFDRNEANRRPLANYVHLDLSKLHQLKELSVNYAFGSSIITTERGGQRQTHEFVRNNHRFTKVSPPTSYYQTKVILPQQAIKVNTILVL